MAEFSASQSIKLNQGNKSWKSSTIALDAMTSMLSVTLQRPTSVNGLSWHADSQLRISFVFIVDGQEYRTIGTCSGGIRTNANGEVSTYSLKAFPTVLLGSRAAAYIASNDPDANGFYSSVPLDRLGETGASVSGYLLLERVSGTINTIIDVASSFEGPAPILDKYKNSVAFDSATGAVENNGDDTISLTHNAGGSNKYAFTGFASYVSGGYTHTLTYAGSTPTEEFDDIGTTDSGAGFAGYSTIPGNGNKTVTGTTSGSTPDSKILINISFTGADQTTPTTGLTSLYDADDTSDASVTVSSPASDSMVLDFLFSRNDEGVTPGTNQTVPTNGSQSTDYPHYAQVSYKSGSNGGTMDEDFTVNNGYMFVMQRALEIQAVGGAATNPKGPLGHPLHGPLAGPIGP